MTFQSALPLRGATMRNLVCASSILFQSALPLRGATCCRPAYGIRSTFQSALPLRGATPQNRAYRQKLTISIRAPLAGSDAPASRFLRWRNISIRAPLAGSDYVCATEFFSVLEFQSALPLRGATIVLLVQQIEAVFQSALPLRGATAIFCSITLLSAKYCSFKDRRRKFIRQIPQNSSRTRYNVVRTSLVEHDRLWFATS